MNIVNPYAVGRLVLLSTIGLLQGCRSSENEYIPPPPPEVTVATPVRESITPFLQENGVVEAVDEAKVSSRVRGFVQEIKFQPGQDVKKGDVLYLIEPDPYQAAVNSAKAALDASQAQISVAHAMVKVAQAEAKRAEQDLAREQTLMKRNAGSQATLDAAIAANDAATANLESALANVEAAIASKGQNEAALANAQLDLDYTSVESPISGRISQTDVKVGNLIENGAQLATVVDRREVFVNFSISDRDMLKFMEARRAKVTSDAGYEDPDWSQIPVYVRRESDVGFPLVGVLNYVDQEGVEADTGTLGMRSKHDNSDNRLVPGLFVTVRIASGDPAEAMLIPEYAVLRDQRGRYVLTVDQDQKVQRVSVSVAKTVSGWAVITDGLTSQSRVVIDGLQRARSGLTVQAIEKSLEVNGAQLLQGLSPTESPLQQADPTGDSSVIERE